MLSLTILLLLFCLCRLDLVDNEEMSSTTSKKLNAEFSTHIESETSTSEMMTSFRANYVTSNAVADTTTGNGNRNWTGWLLERNLKYCGRTGICNGYRRRFCEPCEPCYCDDDCSLYDDCCADFRLINPEQKSQFSCISILYRGIPSDIYREKLPTSQGYRMISSCPDKNHDLSASCRNSPLLGPVTGFDNKTTYKNINCARCNDIQRIQPWQLSIGCSANIGFTFNSKEEMVEAFSKNPNCSVSFSVPDHTDVRRCFDDSSTITKCNVTGQWERFDESVEASCSRYTAVKIVDGQKYANPFCYLCNAANDSKLNECVKGKRQVFPKAFSVLLDFENDRQQTPPVKSRDICSPDEIYDNNKKLCRKIYCSYGKQFKNNLCAPIFDVAKGLALL
ncbi:hypothetical protein SNE40_000148 [Patella caerulea]|uniref:SMB domain-containing protein n=1 Tax=Patella caerulea TaxID=87958 RepID=A0AAN8KGD4_PATCE